METKNHTIAQNLDKTIIQKKYMHPYTHSSTIYNNQDVATT